MLFVTGNKHKFQSVQQLLGQSVRQIDIDLPEVQAIEVKTVIEAKLMAAFQKVGQPVLVEDTGLHFHALNGLPGALIRWFLESIGNEGLCRLLSDFEDRGATAVTTIGYTDGKETLFFSAEVQGQIVAQPRGSGGFGWDPIFQPNGYDRTFAELSAEEISKLSMRQTAVRHLKTYLDKEQQRS